MNVFELILSSVVLVAVLGLIKQSKMNKLQYVTQERSKWRNEIKLIAEELEEKDKNEIHIPLTKLKVQLNGYGANVGNHSEDYLDIFKDEHIWKIIYKLETDCDEAEFVELKRRLIHYLSLLLKFDWERSKEEVKTNNIVLVAILLWILATIIFVFGQKDLVDLKGVLWLLAQPYDKMTEAVKEYSQLLTTSLNYIENIIIMCILYLLAWGPYFFERAVKIPKWYKTWLYLLVAWIAAMSMFFIFCFVRFGMHNVFAPLLVIFMLGALIMPVVYIVRQKEFYLDYENSVFESMTEEPLTVYYSGMPSGFLRLSSYLINLGVNYKSRDSEELVRKKLVGESINYLWNEHKSEKENTYRVLKRRYYYLFWIKHKKDRDKRNSVIEYIRTKPSCSKLIVIHKKGSHSENGKLWTDIQKKRWHKNILWIEKV